MGNKIRHHPQVLLTDNEALNFKSSSLDRDVLPIVEDWRKRGCALAFDLEEFKSGLNIVSAQDAQRLFNVFDTDRNGLIDAHEVLMVYIILCSGDKHKKVETVFEVFDFPGMGGEGSMGFDEAMLLIYACVFGLQKACGDLDFRVHEDELLFTCKGIFDMHRISYDKRLTRAQFREWVWNDVSPHYFLLLFHQAQGLPDIVAEVKKVNEEQGGVFRMLANGRLTVTPKTLFNSIAFRSVIGNPKDEELQMLIDLMVSEDGSKGIAVDKFHATLRPWNIFNHCDLDGSGTLDSKEMEILLWIQMRTRPARDFVEGFVRSIDRNRDGDVSRQEWVEAILTNERAYKKEAAAPMVDSSEDDGDLPPAEYHMSANSRRRSIQAELRQRGLAGDSDSSPLGRRRSQEMRERRRISASRWRKNSSENLDPRSILFAQMVSAG